MDQDLWVKVAVRYWADEKISTLPDADTELLFIRSVASDHAVRTGGFIPESALPELARRRRYAACVDSLVAKGLWSRVDGGYQITRWADWQDALDVLERRRKADRDRKRAKRAAERAAREAASAGTPPVRGQSADASADVRALEKETEKEKGGAGVVPQVTGGQPPGHPPPRTCKKHPNGTDDPCRACMRAREAHETWQAQRRQRAAEAPACPQHPGYPAHNCGGCRSEALADPAA